MQHIIMMLTLADAIEALTDVHLDAGTIITEAAVDSRQVIPGSLFVALPGDRTDGHDFVPQAFQKGASFALIQRDVPGDLRVLDLRDGLDTSASRDLTPPLCLRVENSLAALDRIARF
ncbi:MAG: Mur ligase domain-containing protein, partial [Anaerolineae bacterium]